MSECRVPDCDPCPDRKVVDIDQTTQAERGEREMAFPPSAERDDRVTKHLTPQGVEYRDVDGVVIAKLYCSGGQWSVDPCCPEIKDLLDIGLLHFNSQRAADAYAYVINLERFYGTP